MAHWRQTTACVLLVACVLLAACGVPGAAGDQDTIVFGATLSITGKTAKEGEYARDGYLLYIDTINQQGGLQIGGRTYKLKLKYYNDESRPERAAELYERLISEDKVDFLLGPYGSSTTAVIAPIAEQRQMLLVTGHGSASSIYANGHRYVFSIQTPARNYLRGIIDLVLEKDPTVRRVAVLSEDDVFALDVAEGAVSYAREKGLDVVAQGTYPTNTQDVRSLLANIKAQQAELLLGAGHLQDALLLVRQAKELGVSPRAIGLSVGPTAPEFRETLGADADYVFGSTQWTSALTYKGSDQWHTPRGFAEAFIAKYPYYSSVPYQAAESTVSLIVFQQALERAGSLEPEQVRQALTQTNTTTFFGPIRFDERGVNSGKPMAVVQLQPNGLIYTVYPEPAAERDALYPMPPWSTR